jgi:RNA polymerase sigma-70 factor (ECF subfamily)
MPNDQDDHIFEQHRDALRGLAYRMLGDTASADDAVQDAWIRWRRRTVAVTNPRGYLLTIVARLCLNQLDSARHDPRAWLPEPVEVEDDSAGAGIEIMEQVSMAFLVALQRLNPAERAVLLLHEVFDLTHAEIAAQLDKTEAATRQILKRARDGIAAARGVAIATHDEHRRLLRAFIDAIHSGDLDALTRLLTEDAVLITDGGRTGARVGRVRNLVRPLQGARKIAAFLTAVDAGGWQDTRDHVLNGQPARVAFRDGRPFAALFLAIADERIVQIFIQADAERLTRIVTS